MSYTPMFLAEFTSLSSSSPQRWQENTLTERGIGCLCSQTEQVVDVRRGSTLTCRMPAFQALYCSMLLREAHRWSDICLENILDLSIPAM